MKIFRMNFGYMCLRSLLVICLVVLTCDLLQAQSVFYKGTRKMNLTLGVGTVEYSDKNRATFDQHFGMEWGIAKIADKITVGLGFQVNNSYGGTFDGMVAGKYDYSYNVTTRGKVYDYRDKKWKSVNDVKSVKRNGVGTADADISREDINALFMAGFHFTPLTRLDTYLKVGAGVGVMNYIVSNKRNVSGFSSADKTSVNNSNIVQTTTTYSYDDLDHVKWVGLDSKVVPSMSVYIGASYMMTSKFGLDMQIGVISANLKDKDKGYPNSYGVFAVGASYVF